MGRSYTELECGCLISCDGGGGLVECDNAKACKASEYIQRHRDICKFCGECKVCCIDHCMVGVIKHTCLDWDLFSEEFIGAKFAWFDYCPWCGEKLQKEEENGESSQKEKEGV